MKSKPAPGVEEEAMLELPVGSAQPAIREARPTSRKRDMKASVEETYRRFPKIMARLGE